MLGKFLEELLLFLAPTDNVDIHTEVLGTGDEFMMPLWVLLAHVGVLDCPAPSAAAMRDRF